MRALDVLACIQAANTIPWQLIRRVPGPWGTTLITGIDEALSDHGGPPFRHEW
jgi:hypothetical protein